MCGRLCTLALRSGCWRLFGEYNTQYCHPKGCFWRRRRRRESGSAWQCESLQIYDQCPRTIDEVGQTICFLLRIVDKVTECASATPISKALGSESWRGCQILRLNTRTRSFRACTFRSVSSNRYARFLLLWQLTI